MATLNIDGVGRVTVDDSFKKLSPEDQAKTVDEIVASIKSGKVEAAPAPAKKSGSLLEKARDFGVGVADSVSLGFSDEAYGAGKAALQKLAGSDKSYNELYDQGAKEARDALANSGTAGTVGQMAGFLVPGTGFLKAGNALVKATKLAPTMAKSAAASGLISGGIYGAGSTEGDLADRAIGAAEGAGTGLVGGAVVGKGLQMAGAAGTAALSKIKDAAGVAKPVASLSPEAQALVQQAAPNTQTVSPKAAKALEKLTQNPESVSSDIRVRDLFKAEAERIKAADLQRDVNDNEVFKNIGDKLKGLANATVKDLQKSGALTREEADEVKAVVSRAGRHNRVVTGELNPQTAGEELAKGFKTDTSIIEALNIPAEAKAALNNAVRDLDTVTYNAFAKNNQGIFATLGQKGGTSLGASAGAAVGGIPGAIVGAGVGGAMKNILGKVGSKVDNQLGSSTAPVLRRATQRLAEGLDEAGVKAGNTVDDLTNLRGMIKQDVLAKKAAEKQASDAQSLVDKGIRNEVLKDTRMPLGGGFQELLPGGKSGLNLSSDEAIQGLRLLSRKGGAVGDGAKQILQSPKDLLNDDVFYGVQNALRKLQEKGVVGTAPVKNPEKYQAATIANAIKEALKKGE